MITAYKECLRKSEIRAGYNRAPSQNFLTFVEN